MVAVTGSLKFSYIIILPLPRVVVDHDGLVRSQSLSFAVSIVFTFRRLRGRMTQAKSGEYHVALGLKSLSILVVTLEALPTLAIRKPSFND
jgi:hypothetical protein